MKLWFGSMITSSPVHCVQKQGKHTIRAVNDNLLPDKTRNELREEKKKEEMPHSGTRRSSARVMISNQRPLNGQFSCPGFNV